MSEVPDEMRAVRVHEPGGADALRAESVPVPRPGEGEALVRLEVAGLNFIDVYKRTGLYEVPLPATLGEEGAGTVVQTGAGVSEVRTGDRVAWAGVLGAYAQYAVVPAQKLVPLPAEVSAREGAAVMLQGMTAHYLATSTYPLQEGDRCLVHAAAGGVGLLLVQIARKRGAYVIGTAGSDEKADFARTAGAHEMIVYTRQDFVTEVRRLTDERGVQVIYDSVGRSTFLPGLDALAPRGMMVLFGQSSGPVDPLDPQLLNRKGSLFLTRPSLGHHVSTRDELIRCARELFTWIGAGRISPRICAEYPLEEVKDAHRALELRRTMGKVILRVAEEESAG